MYFQSWDYHSLLVKICGFDDPRKVARSAPFFFVGTFFSHPFPYFHLHRDDPIRYLKIDVDGEH